MSWRTVSLIFQKSFPNNKKMWTLYPYKYRGDRQIEKERRKNGKPPPLLFLLSVPVYLEKVTVHMLASGNAPK